MSNTILFGLISCGWVRIWIWNVNKWISFLGFLPYLTLVVFNLSTYLRLKKIQVCKKSNSVYSSFLDDFQWIFQQEEHEGLTFAQANQREKEIKLSQIGLIIVGGIMWIYLSFLHLLFFSFHLLPQHEVGSKYLWATPVWGLKSVLSLATLDP